MSKAVKEILSVFLCVALFFSFSPLLMIHAEENPTSGDCGANATWNYDTETAALTIRGTGAISDYSSINDTTSAPWGIYYDVMKTVLIESGITSIGRAAFAKCISLTDVSIPNSVKRIGLDAFYRCQNLSNVTIPDSVKSIDTSAFEECTRLTSIEIPNSVTTIGNCAFRYCVSIIDLSIGNSVISIGDSAFAYCSSLTSVTIPDSVTTIGEAVFSGCTELETVTLSQNISIISQSMFNGCTFLEDVIIPNNVKVIGSYSFKDCKSLMRITIPKSVETIGFEAFSGCICLTELYFNAENAATPGQYTKPFYNAGTLTVGITVVFGNTVKKIPDNLFYSSGSSYKPNIKTIYIDKSVTSIGDRAFSGCSSIPDVYYSGTQEQWDAITINYYYNDTLLNATLYVHTHEYSPAVTKEPTCTEEGIKTYSCECGDCYTEPIEKLSHTYTAVITPPTCTEQGYTTHTCLCGDRYVDSYVDATGHTFSAVITPPTCTEQGYTTHTCTCGDSYIDTYVDSLGHTDGDWVVTKQPTASAQGERTLYCAECGEVIRTKPIMSCHVTIDDVSLDYKAKVMLKPTVTADTDVEYAVSYSSSNPNVVKVNEKTGEVTGVKKGSATITCTVTDEFGNTVSDTGKVTVNYTAWQWVIIILLFGWIWY